MKRIFWITSIFTAACFTAYSQDNGNDAGSDDVYYQDDNNSAAPAPATDADQSAPTYQQFYDQLSPYGQWINYPGYGYCWVPNQVPGDFSPYMTGGHWVYTDYGMTWVSDYAWGWGPFHYGRWFQDPTYGWMWVPGYDWAPSWCMWGDYNGYYCWAPFGPGVVISPHYRPDPRWWHFCDHGHIMDEHFDQYALRNDEFESHMHFKIDDVNNHINYISHANTYNQGVFFAGPKAEEIQHYSGHPVTRVAITNTEHPGATHVANNQLNIYRPNIQHTTHQPAPANVKNAENTHPANNRPEDQQPNKGAQQTHGNEQPNREVQQPRGNTQFQRTQTQQPMPPRQNTPRPAQQQPAQRQQQPERSFIPTERPAQQAAPQRSAPSPSFHSGGGGGGGASHGGGGGRR